eukprot:14369076-Alexandrium_andersonii.AAC.1
MRRRCHSRSSCAGPPRAPEPAVQADLPATAGACAARQTSCCSAGRAWTAKVPQKLVAPQAP